MAVDYSQSLDQYNRDGYVIFRDVIDADLIKECQQHMEFLQKKYPSIPGEQFHHHIMRNDPFWVRLVSDQRLLDLAATFGASFIKAEEGVALFSSHYICKPAKTGVTVLWHQDGAYWPLKPMNVLTIWLAVDESDRENGCLRVIRGSHKQELGKVKDDSTTPNALGSYTHRDADIDQSQIVDIVLKPGDVSIHHPSMIHGSEANTSDRRRCGLTIRYIAPTTECLDEKQPVLMLSGTPVPGINHYRSWPKYRPGYDFPFDGCEQWNEKRRIVPEDEPYFDRTDYDQMDKEIEKEVLSFVVKLTGETPAK
jgi:phytanoyl-CoA hydroxylase